MDRRIAKRTPEERRSLLAEERRQADKREDRTLLAARRVEQDRRSDRVLSRDGRFADVRRESLSIRGAIPTESKTHARSENRKDDRRETEERRFLNALNVPERRELGGSRLELNAQNRRDMRSNNGEKEMTWRDTVRLENNRASDARSRMSGRRIHRGDGVRKERDSVRLERLVLPNFTNSKESDINNNELALDVERKSPQERWTSVRLGEKVYRALADFVSMDVPQNRLTAKVRFQSLFQHLVYVKNGFSISYLH